MPLSIDIQDLFTGRVVGWEPLEFKKGGNPEAAQVVAIQKKLLELDRAPIQPSYHPLALPTTVQGQLILFVGAQSCPDDTAVVRGKTALQPLHAVLHTSASVKNHLSPA